MAKNGKSFPMQLIVLLVVLVAVVVCLVMLVTCTQPTPESVRERAAQSSAQASAASVESDSEEGTAMTFKHMLDSGNISSIHLVGDSITAGFGTDGYEDPDLVGQGTVIYDDGAGNVHYETSASAQSWANAFRLYASEHGVSKFVNAGINGAFMQELADNPDAWLADGADVTVVALGTNDAGYYGPQEFRAAAETALAAAASKSKLVVVLSPVDDLRPESQLVEPAAALGDVLHALCDQHGYVFVDTRNAVTPEMFCPDGLHPNTQGSLAIWDCLRTTLGL